MSNYKLIKIDPKRRFPFELKRLRISKNSFSLLLTNKTDENVGFKIVPTNSEKFDGKPNTGVVLAKSTFEILVSMSSSDMQEKIRIRAIASPDVRAEEVTHEMISEDAGHLVDETTPKVTYVNKKLLTIEPPELQFPFELKKQISCSLFLINKTENHVAFKVKTTNPIKYCIRPNVGVVLPRSTSEVIVTMQAQKVAPSDMQCKDKFLIQAVIASPDVTKEEVIEEMFSKNAGHVVEETKLKATYICSSTTTIISSPKTRPPLLIIDPMELQFRCIVASGTMPHNIFFKNTTVNNVAIKLMSENPKNYLAGLGKDLIRPMSTYTIEVVLRARRYDMQFRDKIIVQAVIVGPGVMEDGVTEEMFRKEAGHLVEETTLNVKFF